MHAISARVAPVSRCLSTRLYGRFAVVEALRNGRAAVGADASPLALFVAVHQSWRPTDSEMAQVREMATLAIRTTFAAKTPGKTSSHSMDANTPARTRPLADWAPLRDALHQLLPEAQPAHEPSPLWFCFSAALQRAERWSKRADPRISLDPVDCFDRTVDEYLSAISQLKVIKRACCSSSLAQLTRFDAHSMQEVVPSHLPAVRVCQSDARQLQLVHGLVDAIVTSPPYPGVYDYLSFAREERAKLTKLVRGEQESISLMGTTRPSGRVWPEQWSSSLESE